MLNLIDKFLTSINKTLNLISETCDIDYNELLEFSLEDFDINEIEPRSVSEDENGNIIDYNYYFDLINNFENIKTFIDLIEHDNEQLLADKEISFDDCRKVFYKLKFLNQNCFEKMSLYRTEINYCMKKFVNQQKHMIH